MKNQCKKTGVKHFSFLALRNAGASIMDNNNVPIGSIQKILGHENRTANEIYLHNLGNCEREAMKIARTSYELFTHRSTHEKTSATTSKNACFIKS